VTKKTNGITSLLAARPTALRRAPKSANPSGLRISRSESQEDTPAKTAAAQQASSSLGQAEWEDTARKLDVALAGIHATLMDFVDRAVQIAAGRRSPRQIAEIQSMADGLVRDVDRMALAVEVDGRPLLARGEASVSAAILRGPKSSLPISPMQSDDLGPAPNRTLSALQTGGQSSILLTSIEVAIEIVRHAANQVSVQRSQLSAFARRESGSDQSAMSIADENRAAAGTAQNHDEFIEIAGALTRGNLLAKSQTARPTRAAPSNPPSLSISRGDEI
jgi:flagellin-like hook-associated protein FlgL